MPCCPGSRHLRLLVAPWLLAMGSLGHACVEGDVRGEVVQLEKSVDVHGSGERTSVPIHGAGWFRAVSVEKRGGTTDQTTVTIELDGEEMISTSFATLKNAWNQLSTSFIVAHVRTQGDLSVMTIWYSPELKFRALANLRVEIDEDGVESVKMNAVMNKPAPHEHVPGQPGTVAALPAFK